MKRLAPSSSWTRAVAAMGLAVTLNAAAPVHAEVVAAPARTDGQTVPLPAPGSPGAAPVFTDEMIDAIAQKVLARLTDESRPSILDVAERLVREEIERIKSIG